MKRVILIVMVLGLFSVKGLTPDPQFEFDSVKYWTNQLGGGYYTNNITSTFRIYPSDYRSRMVASIVNSGYTIK